MKSNIIIKEEVKLKLEKYRELLIEWNKKMNLTAITDNEEVWIKHFEDSLECVKYIKEGDKIIDIGTGAGFPGLVIAIFFEDKVKVTLLDALNKRMTFLSEVVNQLGIKNVSIVHARAEEYAHKQEFREQYDVVLTRAVAKLNVLMEYTIPYLKVGGKAVYMKSVNLNDEIETSKKAEKLLYLKNNGVHEYMLEVKEEKIYRSIVEYTKLKDTDTKYPRMFSKIKSNPL